jgi:hypothetical protein
LSNTVTGPLEGLIPRQVKGKDGSPLTAYDIIVNGTKYGIGFKPVKFATGEIITFQAEQNGNFWNADAKTIRSTGQHAPVQSTPTAAATAGSVSGNDPRQRSIELQSSIASASRIVAAQITAGHDINPGTTVAGLVREFMGILHPKPKPAPAPKPAPEPEPDDFGDDIPY